MTPSSRSADALLGDDWQAAVARDWAPLLPGLAPPFLGARCEQLAFTSQNKLLLAVTVPRDRLAGIRSAFGADLSPGGVLMRPTVTYYVADEDGVVSLEAHHLIPAGPLDLTVVQSLLSPELLAVCARQNVREVGCVRGEKARAQLKLHLVEDDAEAALLALGFGESEVGDGVPALVRGAETVLPVGGSWYVYGPALPEVLPVSVEEQY